MIDIQVEEPISFAEAAKQLPPRRAGKRPNIATLYRWSQEGCRGVRLETICIGATRCTSMEALQRFFDALTAKAERRYVPQPPKLTAARRKAIEAAERRLAAAGV